RTPIVLFSCSKLPDHGIFGGPLLDRSDGLARSPGPLGRSAVGPAGDAGAAFRPAAVCPLGRGDLDRFGPPGPAGNLGNRPRPHRGWRPECRGMTAGTSTLARGRGAPPTRCDRSFPPAIELTPNAVSG